MLLSMMKLNSISHYLTCCSLHDTDHIDTQCIFACQFAAVSAAHFILGVFGLIYALVEIHASDNAELSPLRIFSSAPEPGFTSQS